MATHKVVPAPKVNRPKKRRKELRKILEDAEEGGFRLVETVEVGGRTTELVLVRR